MLYVVALGNNLTASKITVWKMGFGCCEQAGGGYEQHYADRDATPFPMEEEERVTRQDLTPYQTKQIQLYKVCFTRGGENLPIVQRFWTEI